MCPGCQKPIKAYDNIPLLSFIWLQGRCRYCHQTISPRYPIIEFLSGLAGVVVVMKFGITLSALVYYIFIITLLVITFIDIDHRIIPDAISLPGIVFFFLTSIVLPTISVVESIIGIFIGGGSLFLVAWLYRQLTHKEGMGGGDIKLLAMIGALLGYQGVLFTIFASSLIGTVTGIFIMAVQRKKDLKLAVPFGPFLSIGAVLYVFLGRMIIDWYFSLFSRT
jgi:leader peptidase (prepilin peptidase)/N-methyltransferase